LFLSRSCAHTSGAPQHVIKVDGIRHQPAVLDEGPPVVHRRQPMRGGKIHDALLVGGEGRVVDHEVGPQATARLAALVGGRPVQIEVALRSRDRHVRLLASIWRDRVLIQGQLVREELCVPYTVPPNLDYVDRIRAAAKLARRDGLGIYEPARPLLESPREHRERRSALDPA
jgi:hypothetical protein